MGVLLTRLEWKKEGTSEPEVIEDWEKIRIRISTELKNNQMTIILKNPFGRNTKRKYVDSAGSHVFKVQDRFKIYAKYDISNSGLDTTDNSNDLIFIGDLKDIDSNVNDNNSTFELACSDRSFALLNGIWTFSYKSNDKNAPNGEGWTAPLIIQHIIRFKSQATNFVPAGNDIYDNEGNTIFISQNSEPLFVDSRLASDDGFIQDDRTKILAKDGTQTTRTDFGTPDTDNSLFPISPIGTRNYNFPLKDYTIVGKPVYEVLLDLSQRNMTNTENEEDPENASFSPVIKRTMRFYLDEKNRFHWFYPSDTVDKDKFQNSQAITMGTIDTFEVKSHKLKFSLYEVINFIYFEAGKDMNGNEILGIVYDATSGAPVFKDTRRNWPRIAQEMKRQDEQAGNIVENPAKKSGFDFPISYSPAIRPAWNTKITVSSDGEYNDEFKKEARRRSQGRALAIISRVAKQKWKGKIEFAGHNFTVGDLIQYTSEDGGIYQVKLRITEASHDISKSGWFVNLNVEEDEKELEA